ncbi:MAG TPA: protein kinase [Steroidobacteraceae bacterium]
MQESLERGEYSRASDVFMFGMLICETVTGRKPFANVESVHAASAKIINGEWPPRPAGVDGALWALAERCWTRDPAGRPTMVDVIAALDACGEAPGSAAVYAPPLQPPAGSAAGPSVLSVLLTRAYGPKVRRDVVEDLTWPALAEMLTEELVKEMVAVEGRVNVLGVLNDMKHLVRQYR